MAIGILGRKVGMTQLYDESGQVVPVTVIQAGPCDVLQVRTVERDGYEAVQLGFGDKSRRLAGRSVRGHVAKLDSKRSKKRSAAGVELLPKAGCEPKRFVREIRGPAGELAVGGQVKVEALADVKTVDITGICKGRGFSAPSAAIISVVNARRMVLKSATERSAAPAPAPSPAASLKGSGCRANMATSPRRFATKSL